MELPDLSGWNGAQLATLIIVVWLTTVGGLVALYLKTRATGNNAENAAQNAEAANRQTVATGNGFAARVKEDLSELKSLIAEFRVESQANAARIEHRLDEHMNNHDRRNNA